MLTLQLLDWEPAQLNDRTNIDPIGTAPSLLLISEIAIYNLPTKSRTMSAEICGLPATLAVTRQVQPPESLTPMSLITMPQSMSEKPKYWSRPLSACLLPWSNWTVRP